MAYKRGLQDLHTVLSALDERLNTYDPEALTTPIQLQVLALEQDLAKTQTETEDRFLEVATAVEQLQATARDHLLAIDEGISQVERAENRVKQVIRRAKAKLAADGVEDPGIEAEDRQLREGNGEGSAPVGVPPVSKDVGIVDPETGRIKGVPGRFTKAR